MLYIMEGKQKILLVIRDSFLRFLYNGFFRTKGFEVLEAGSERKMRNFFKKEKIDLIVFGMHLTHKDAQALAYKAMLDKIPIMILQINETNGLLEEHLKYDQYVYVDVLHDQLSDVLKKARKIMSEYK